MFKLFIGSILLACFLLIPCAVGVVQQEKRNSNPSHESQELDDDAKRAQESMNELRRSRLLIRAGREQEALDYYNRISSEEELGFDFLRSNMDSLLFYMGYAKLSGSKFSGLLAEDLEDLDSFDLMPSDDDGFQRLKDQVGDKEGFEELLTLEDFLSDRVLVARFFAPKIATYFDPEDEFSPIDSDEIIPGWRKLVRLKPRTDSLAESAGVKHIYILFNFKKADPNVNPFGDNESGNNQVIIVPLDQDAKDSAYFAVYQSKSLGYPIGTFLAADFDLPGHAGSPDETPGAEDGKYFVPRSCAECHGHSKSFGALRGEPVDAEGNKVEEFVDEEGNVVRQFSQGNFRFAKPNYLDTDQWYDWLNYDYRGVAGSLNDVLFDGSKDHGSAKYAQAFEVIRKINTDIGQETLAAEQIRGEKSYQSLAVEKWVELHTENILPVPYSNRSIGNESWDSSNVDEMRLLRLLNNHCFRCHSSLLYNVFDKETVGGKNAFIKANLASQVNDADGVPLPGFFMPQGRVLTSSDRNEIIRLMRAVFDEE